MYPGCLSLLLGFGSPGCDEEFVSHPVPFGEFGACPADSGLVGDGFAGGWVGDDFTAAPVNEWPGVVDHVLDDGLGALDLFEGLQKYGVFLCPGSVHARLPLPFMAAVVRSW
jgi:hypothetical protein